MIKAEIYSNNYKYYVKFDATQCFEKSSDCELIDLINSNFIDKTNKVAKKLSFTDSKLAFFFSCLDDNSYQSTLLLNVYEAVCWIGKNRPHLIKFL
jgi:hypothetical protein